MTAPHTVPPAAMGTDETLKGYDLVMHHSRDIVLFIRRCDGRILEANPAAVKAYGYSYEELRNLTIKDLRAEQTRTTVERDMAAAEVGAMFETVHRRKDGREFPVEVNTQGITLATERVFLSIVRDISDRKKIEHALQLREAEFRTLLDNAPDVICRFDRQCRHTYINPACVGLRGLRPDEIVGKTHRELHWPEQLCQQWEKAIGEVFATGKRVEFACEFPRPGREPAHFQIRLAAEQTRAGEVVTVIGVARDMTALKIAERALQNSEEKYRAFFSLAAVGMASAEVTTGKLLEVNDKLSQITGYSRDELLSKRFSDFTHPDDRDRDFADFQRTVRGEMSPYVVEKRYIRKDGSIVWVLVNAALIHDTTGKPLRTAAVILDITNWKIAENSLRQSESRLQFLIRHAPAAIAMFDRDMRYLMASNRWLADYGLNEERVLGKSHYEVFPEIPERWKNIHRRCLAGAIERCEADPFVRADGSTQWIRWEIKPWFEANGRQGGIFILTEDITARKEAELALYAASQRLQSHLENSPVAVVEFDTDLRIRRWTKAAQRVFGWTAQEIVGKAMWDLPWIHEDDREKVANISAKLLTGADPQNVSPNRNVRRDGSTIYCEWYNSALHDVAGKLISIFSIVLDVTERVRAQQALQAAKEEAERASQAKDHFLAVLSHELRTPLTPVLTTAQMMEADPTLTPVQREAAKLIHRNVAVETRLIDDLLDLNRLARGKINLYRVPVDVHEVIHHVVRTCRGDLQDKQQDLIVMTAAADHVVEADPARLEQILWNLLRNAVKFTMPGGNITITTSNPAENTIALAVADTGVGISPDVMPRIFQAFEQGGKEITRQFGGLGLGLAISKNLADLHGGQLTAHSPGSGQGATFTLQLPTSKLPTPHGYLGGPHGVSPIPRNRKVLLVEDHPDTARVMASLLRSMGLQVDVAQCMAEGLRKIQHAAYDLLISDIGLPDGNGLDLMRQARALKTITGIALSGFGMEEDIRKSLEAGFAAHLTKPVDVKALEQTLGELFRQKI